MPKRYAARPDDCLPKSWLENASYETNRIASQPMQVPLKKPPAVLFAVLLSQHSIRLGALYANQPIFQTGNI